MFVKVTNSHLWKTSCNGNISIAGIITILVAASQVFLWFATSIFRNIFIEGFYRIWFKYMIQTMHITKSAIVHRHFISFFLLLSAMR